MHPETARRGRRLYGALAFLGLDVPAAVPSGLGRLTRLEGAPCADCAAALTASWRLRPA